VIKVCKFYQITKRGLSYGNLEPTACDYRAAISTDIASVIYCVGCDGIPFESLCLAPVDFVNLLI